MFMIVVIMLIPPEDAVYVWVDGNMQLYYSQLSFWVELGVE